MKGIYGLVLAIGLGVAGALLNWNYLARKARDVEKVAFVGIASGVSINRGDTFQDTHLVPVEIPKSNVGALADFAVLYADRQTVVGMNAVRSYNGGELLLRQDLKTPPPELKLVGDDERAIGVPVDSKTFVPSLVTPGDWVSFLFPTANQPTPAGAEPANPNEPLGPFRVLSVGNRLGSPEVMQAARVPQLQENVLLIRVKWQGDKLEPKAQKLWDLLQRSNFQQVGVVLHPRKRSDDD